MHEYTEVIEERNGYRARIVADYYPSEPENDGGCPIIRIDANGYGGAQFEHTGYGDYYDAGFDPVRVLTYFNTVRGRYEDALEVFERYVRIFHEGTVEWRLGSSREYGYVTFTTRKLAQEWGVADAEPVPAAEMVEWTSYIEGDVWIVVIEEQTITTSEVRNLEGRVIHSSEDETWTEVDSCGGHYGQEWAEQSARETLGYYADKAVTA
jgi:hypothetical protein